MADLPGSEGDELRMLYQVTVSDLSYFKTQQWNVSYYGLLLDAGLIGVAQTIAPPIQLSERVFLGVLCVLVAWAALFMLSKLQRSIVLRQSRLDAVRRAFGKAFAHAWAAEVKEEEKLQSVVLLRAGIVVTTALALWLITVRISAV